MRMTLELSLDQCVTETECGGLGVGGETMLRDLRISLLAVNTGPTTPAKRMKNQQRCEPPA